LNDDIGYEGIKNSTQYLSLKMKHDGSLGLLRAMHTLFATRAGADLSVTIHGGNPAAEPLQEPVHAAVMMARSPCLFNMVTEAIDAFKRANEPSVYDPTGPAPVTPPPFTSLKDTTTDEQAAIMLQALVRGVLARARVAEEQGFRRQMPTKAVAEGQSLAYTEEIPVEAATMKDVEPQRSKGLAQWLGRPVLVLPEMTHSILLKLLEYIYTGNLETTDSDALQLLEVSEQLMLLELKEFCIAHLKELVSPPTSPSIIKKLHRGPYQVPPWDLNRHVAVEETRPMLMANRIAETRIRQHAEMQLKEERRKEPTWDMRHGVVEGEVAWQQEQRSHAVWKNRAVISSRAYRNFRPRTIIFLYREAIDYELL